MAIFALALKAGLEGVKHLAVALTGAPLAGWDDDESSRYRPRKSSG
jgi:hypothetical protein